MERRRRNFDVGGRVLWNTRARRMHSACVQNQNLISGIQNSMTGTSARHLGTELYLQNRYQGRCSTSYPA